VFSHLIKFAFAEMEDVEAGSFWMYGTRWIDHILYVLIYRNSLFPFRDNIKSMAKRDFSSGINSS